MYSSLHHTASVTGLFANVLLLFPLKLSVTLSFTLHLALSALSSAVNEYTVHFTQLLSLYVPPPYAVM